MVFLIERLTTSRRDGPLRLRAESYPVSWTAHLLIR
jgi:hypothetical protein